jgi:hypothetical protein
MFDYDNDFENGEMVCDCGCHVESFDGYFIDCIDQVKEYGWIIKKIKNSWYHFCSEECYNNALGRWII